MGKAIKRKTVMYWDNQVFQARSRDIGNRYSRCGNLRMKRINTEKLIELIILIIDIKSRFFNPE